ncbi:Neuroligin-3 [Branchiostoma belcheri]|nr:Neuroligin-3 [Branchiostoma belcheri]
MAADVIRTLTHHLRPRDLNPPCVVFSGFLSAGDPGLLGNYGIRDQMMALQWVKTNIGYFGGSGSDVTLFGHQTGADCAAILLLSPMAKAIKNVPTAQVDSPKVTVQVGVQRGQRPYICHCQPGRQQRRTRQSDITRGDGSSDGCVLSVLCSRRGLIVPPTRGGNDSMARESQSEFTEKMTGCRRAMRAGLTEFAAISAHMMTDGYSRHVSLTCRGASSSYRYQLYQLLWDYCLFKRVILSGSSPLRPLLLRSADDMRRESYQLAVTFNCGGYDNAAGIADCLRKLKYQVFLQREADGSTLTPVLDDQADGSVPGSTLTPVLDGQADGSVPGSTLTPVLDGQVVPAFPDAMLRRMQVNGEACLLGFTGREWAPRAMPGSGPVAMDGGMSEKDFHHHMDVFLKDLSPYAPPELASLVTYQYTNWSQAGDRFTTTDNYIQAISDALFVAPAVSSAERMMALDLPSYVYQYRYPTAEGDRRTPIKDDVFLVFSAGGPLTQREQTLRLRLADLFGSFIRTGVPKWQSRPMNTFTAGRQDYLKIGKEEAEMDRYPRRRQVTFWNEVFPSLLRVVDKTRRSPRPTKPTKVSRPTEEAPDITWTTKGIIIGIMVVGIFLPVMTAFFVMYVADFKQQRRNRKLLYQMSDEHRYAPPPTIQVNDKPYHLQLSEDV